jgi:cyclophilin family peptidyl-prolyl cis-trans isomerase
MKDYYADLEVPIDASQEKIKEQYHFMLQAWHPDKFTRPRQKAKAEEKAKQINEAYETLGDHSKRAEYDLQRNLTSVPKSPSATQTKPTPSASAHVQANSRPAEVNRGGATARTAQGQAYNRRSKSRRSSAKKSINPAVYTVVAVLLIGAAWIGYNIYSSTRSASGGAVAKQWSAPPPMTIDVNKQYTAHIATVKGTIDIQLLPKDAPKTVNSFVFLARQGFYDGVTFHRVIPNFMAQGGDPTGTGSGGPGYMIPNETSTGLKFDQAGLLAMANSGPDTNGSQFFITYGPAPNLNGSYTIFGRVTAGLDVALALTPRDPQSNPTAPPGDKIITVKIDEK